MLTDGWQRLPSKQEGARLAAKMLTPIRLSAEAHRWYTVEVVRSSKLQRAMNYVLDRIDVTIRELDVTIACNCARQRRHLRRALYGSIPGTVRTNF
jgi:hypothetical protein